MSRAGKITSIVIAVIIVVLLVLWGVLYAVASHMDWRKLLEKQVKEHTGRTLVIKGSLDWHIFPHISVEAHDVSLSNPPSMGQGNLATIKTLDVSLATLPLIFKHVDMQKFTLSGADIQLLKNAKGQANWAFGAPAAKTESVQAAEPQAGSTGSFNLPKVSLPNLSIQNSTLHYVDKTAGQNIAVTDFNLNVKNLQQGDRFPLTTSFNINANKPAMKGKVSLDAKVLWEGDRFDLSPVTLKTALRGSGLPGSRLNLNFKGHLTATPKSFALKGGSLNYNGMQVDDITIKAVKDNGQLTISPISLKMYQGQVLGQASTKLANQFTQFNLTFKQINIGPLIAAVSKVDKITGTANGNVSASLMGGNMATLNGKGRFEVVNGQYQGGDLLFIYRTAMNVIKPHSVGTRENTGVTKFGDMRLSFVAKNGVVSTNDLTVSSAVLGLTGKGSANLARQTINMRLKAQGMQGSTSNPTPVGPEIPLLVTGSLSSPSISPDLGSLLQNTLKGNLDSIGKQIKGINIGGLFK
ncbi:MAG: hypothetical protein COV52_00610 [Gammaproteobacteria bacterium CG11_big_fil_rev_8_21_14_0_20_46_22]|nr:MAG: hypothetical protein COW05_06430 [Gammaproteobacteria bacterium CG12_big_fil_rev_8_21_14_0_65_46_12]PIR12046.1 MAG: hypothetical protein COV52_00610 [Gammaproteobacteria bacterium CG11_big_fil_rev_8_21_14_0_20_46_22]